MGGTKVRDLHKRTRVWCCWTQRKLGATHPSNECAILLEWWRWRSGPLMSGNAVCEMCDAFLILSQQPSRNIVQQVLGSGPEVWVLLGPCPPGHRVSEDKWQRNTPISIHYQKLWGKGVLGPCGWKGAEWAAPWKASWKRLFLHIFHVLFKLNTLLYFAQGK